MNRALGLAVFLARARRRLIPVGVRAIRTLAGGDRDEQMTGKEMKRIRLRMGLPVVEFGIEVLGSAGDLNTVSKWVRRMEKLDEPLSDETVRKVMEAYRLWQSRRGGRS